MWNYFRHKVHSILDYTCSLRIGIAISANIDSNMTT